MLPLLALVVVARPIDRSNWCRVVYTSPLKALSNQKFRELGEDFEDVGLMTGDNSLHPNATCIVMTTEIMRSMIYKGSETMREVAWVIFDEVHYMKDKERGVVWEESIIFLPPQVKMVFLSATLSNAAEFAGWVASLRGEPCHVVYTDQRPVPLQVRTTMCIHYSFLHPPHTYSETPFSHSFVQRPGSAR